MAKKRAGRVIAFTEESVKDIPVGRGYMDFWYDKDRPYFAARRLKGKDVEFLVTVSTRENRLLHIMGRTDIGRYVRLGKMPLEDARKLADETYNDLQSLAAKAQLMAGSIPKVSKKRGKPQAMLDDQQAVENPSYESLMGVLMDAYSQAANGKGAERHGNGLNFEDQDMLKTMDQVGIGFGLGQAIKKTCEGRRMPMAQARREFLGAIVYLAGSVIWLDRQVQEEK